MPSRPSHGSAIPAAHACIDDILKYLQCSWQVDSIPVLVAKQVSSYNRLSLRADHRAALMLSVTGFDRADQWRFNEDFHMVCHAPNNSVVGIYLAMSMSL
jgi:hypothetical protein